MAAGRLVAMASTLRGASNGVDRVLTQVPLLKDHGEVSLSHGQSKTNPCMFDIARLANARVVVHHCIAPTLSRHEGILRKEERIIHNSLSQVSGRNVARSFEAEADVGRVECSAKGCRPVTSTSSFMSMACPVRQEGFPPHTELPIKIRPSVQPQEDDGRGRLWSRSAATTTTFEEAMQDVAPLDSQQLSEFAVLSWTSLGDVNKVEALYQQALDHASPDDTDLLAGYASFLWQCDQ